MIPDGPGLTLDLPVEEERREGGRRIFMHRTGHMPRTPKRAWASRVGQASLPNSRGRVSGWVTICSARWECGYEVALGRYGLSTSQIRRLRVALELH